MTDVRELHEKWMQEPGYRQAHEALQQEFDLASQMIAARVRAGLTQEQLAQRMGTTQSAIARLEGGGRAPSVKTLEKYAEATGTRLVLRFEGKGNAA